MALSRTHPHLRRRRWLEGSSTPFLVDLGLVCLRRQSLQRLERLVGDVLLERWRALPPAQFDPESGELLPF
jgi:hypothetical protein